MSGPRYDTALRIQSRVIRALILRDIRTRMFGNGLGYVVAILWPLTHIGVLLIIWSFRGRAALVGPDAAQSFAIALVPAIAFSYMSRWIMQSSIHNRPLMNFPVVKFIDIVIARSILEAACSVCVAAVLAVVLYALDVPVTPNDTVQASEAFAAALLLGLGMGTMNAVIVLKLPMWVIVYTFIRIILYISSGVIFLPNSLPAEAQAILAWNPLLHAVEWMRQAFFLGYVSSILDKTYLLESGIGLLFVSLVVERGMRDFLMRR